MKYKTFTLFVFVIFILGFVCEGSGKDRLPVNWPTKSWQTSTPEKQGMDSAQLAKLFDFVQKNKVNIHSLMVIRNGYVLLEGYFYPNSKGVLHDLASVTKSITSTLIGIAIDKGYIKGVDQSVLDFFPKRKISNLDKKKKKLTVEDLLTMRTGFCRDYYHGERQLDQMRRSNDWIQFMLDLPLLSEPGTKFAYCSGASQLLSAIVTQATGKNELEFAREYLFQPLGIKDVIWPADAQGNNTGWGDFFMHSRDMAKIGYLFLKEGKWQGKQVISRYWIKKATKRIVTLPGGEGYGYRWWIPDNPQGVYEARGRGGQRICVWPEKKLVVVFTGCGFEPGNLGAFLRKACCSDQPIAENPNAYKLLQEKIKLAAKTPSPKPIAELPPMARKISGKTYRFESNDFGFISFSLIFNKKEEALLQLIERNHQEENRIGLDDVYRISYNSRFGLPEALKGQWVTESDFDLLYNEFANNHIFDIRIHFEGDTASLRIIENTGLVNTTIKAIVQKN